MPKMIPIAHHESHLDHRVYPQQIPSAFASFRTAQRPVWIPPMVSFARSNPMLFSRPVAPAPLSAPSAPLSMNKSALEFTSEDELCAANVLVSFSPKESTNTNAATVTSTAVTSRTGSFDSSPGHVTEDSIFSDCSSSENSVAESSLESSRVPVNIKSTSNDDAWYPGCISLSLPEDDDVLSPLHCFMRRYCVEAFTATPQDVATPRYGKSHGVKVVAGQVGIRCLYCKCRPIGKRPERAVCYPSSLKNIYHSIETWQRRHSLVCSDIPTWVRKSMLELMESSKSRAGGRRQYWEDSAIRIGMVDTPFGVRFNRAPGDLKEPVSSPKNDGFEPRSVVEAEDKEMVTGYLFLLMDQMQTCRFTEEDRTGGRSKIKNNSVGFPGMQCKHCLGKAGFGRYFPASVNALALANSDRNINNHIQKCRRCPQQVKAELTRLSKDQSQGKNRRGLRKLFFGRVWERMHGEETC